MTDPSKIKPSHTQRAAFVYIRQSTPGQVEHNRESTARQYALADRACQLGWPKEQVVIVDEDLGLSGSSIDKRSGFARLTSEVALAHVGIVLGLEFLAWRGTMRTGIVCWNCVASPILSLAITTASITRRCSTIVFYSASIDLIHKAPLIQLPADQTGSDCLPTLILRAVCLLPIHPVGRCIPRAEW